MADAKGTAGGSAARPTGARKVAGAKKAPQREILAAKKRATADLRATGATAAKTPRKNIGATADRTAGKVAANLASAAQRTPTRRSAGR
jgi:hypothetical protein